MKNSFLEGDNASSLYKKALGGLTQFKDEREWTRTDVIMARSTKKINTRVQMIAIVENYTLHFLFFAINFVRYAEFLSFLFHFENYHPEKNPELFRILNFPLMTLDISDIRRFFSFAECSFLFAHYCTVVLRSVSRNFQVFCTGISPQFIRKRRITLHP